MARRANRPNRLLAPAALAAIAGTVALLAAVPAVASATPAWRLAQPDPPEGAPFKVPLGAPADLQFWAPNRGLLAVEGNSLIPRGLFYWNGVRWRQLATVCGGSAQTMRIAWAGPDEFWTISAPSKPRIGDGITLCRFKGGKVVASYGTLPQSPDPFRVMNAATCLGANDCWFGGASSSDPSGGRWGAFRLHWNGSTLVTSYGPQGRGISDLQAYAGGVYESVFVGPGNEQPGQARLREPENAPRLIHKLGTNSEFGSDPFVPAVIGGVPADGTELNALGSDGTSLWAVGGGAASGPSAPTDGIVNRIPLAARKPSAGAPFSEVALAAPVGTFSAGDRFGDVAPLPGTDEAWVALQAFTDRGSANARGRVALVNAATGAVSAARLPSSGSGRGSVSRIACPAADDCWAATYGGWLFRWSESVPALPEDTDPAFGSLITFRPNESASQFVPDAPPEDDSLKFAPPPVEVIVEKPPETVTKKVAALLRKVRSKLKGTRLTISFTLSRKAKVAIVARRGGKVVARTPARNLKPGRRSLTLQLDRKRWPNKLAFSAREPGQNGGGEDDSVTTGSASVPSPEGAGR
ncbi:MAG: hypothetical protein KGR19_08780 [Acidobacteria bacterium]|nr:hypothetical protein [Acidobacteriota bacterium]